MPKHQQQQTPVAGFVAAALDGGQEVIEFPSGEVFSVVHHFVESCLNRKSENPRRNRGSLFGLSTKWTILSRVDPFEVSDGPFLTFGTRPGGAIVAPINLRILFANGRSCR